MAGETRTDAVKYVLIRAGYGFFDTDLPQNITEKIVEMLELKDGRLAKAIPFIFYKSMPKQNPAKNMFIIDLERLEQLAKEKGLEDDLFAVCFITWQVLKETNRASIWQFKLSEFANRPEKAAEKLALVKLFGLDKDALIAGKGENFKATIERLMKNVGYMIMSLRDYIDDFEMQVRMEKEAEEKGFTETVKTGKEIITRLALAELLSPKQIEILNKVMDGDKLTKTEYEYYSRIVKKRLDAITKAYEFAMVALEKKPLK